MNTAKPLFWYKSTDHPQDGGHHSARGIGGRYSIERQRDNSWLLWMADDNFVWKGPFKSGAEAKAVAEADWQQQYAAYAASSGLMERI